MSDRCGCCDQPIIEAVGGGMTDDTRPTCDPAAAVAWVMLALDQRGIPVFWADDNVEPALAGMRQVLVALGVRPVDGG